MNKAIEQAVNATFPTRSVQTIETQNTRPGNETGFVAFSNGESCYVKTATDTSIRLTRETAATRYAGKNCEIEIPSVIAADTTGDLPYLITEPLPGTVLSTPWTEDADRASLLKQTGFTIAGVHETGFDHSGIITDGSADTLELTEITWTETLCKTIEWRAEDWFADRFSDIPERLTETIREIHPTLDSTTPTLLHGDPGRNNIHLDPNGLLDWERAFVGDPAFGLTNAAFHHLDQPDVDEAERSTLVSALYEGYRERAGELPNGLDDRRPLYRATSYLLYPQAFNDWASSIDVPDDELAADVRDEFDTRLGKARDSSI
jgi:aminoglycoside phosphotransferase